MSARLYGRTMGNGSLAVVTAGFRRVLERESLLDGVYPLDRGGTSDEDEEPPGALARDGIFTGALNLLPLMLRNTRHERHWIQVTPNSTHIPPKLLGAVLKIPNVHILSASDWGTSIIRANLFEMGVTPEMVATPILTVHHGVHGFAPWADELQKTREDYRRGCFRVVHFSTSDGERKGTMELLRAWKLFCSSSRAPDMPELLLVLDHHAREALVRRCVDEGLIIPPAVKLLPRADMGPAAMSRFLCQQHLVACPSRGEGFSLPPLEARASGVPVITTVTTGNGAGHCHGPGVVRIHQPSRLYPIDDGPGALALAVDPGSIVDALVTAHTAWEGLSGMCEAAAEQVRETWSWENQLAPLVARLRA